MNIGVCKSDSEVKGKRIIIPGILFALLIIVTLSIYLIILYFLGK